jgi:hypothetical protein
VAKNLSTVGCELVKCNAPAFLWSGCRLELVVPYASKSFYLRRQSAILLNISKNEDETRVFRENLCTKKLTVSQNGNSRVAAS